MAKTSTSEARITAEALRLEEAREKEVPWRQWGPYLSERQWGTVREDYSNDGNAWDYFSHDQARSRAYHWGEDGLAGISDDHQRLCFALALWNGKDPILKERGFGLTNSEANHGEDVARRAPRCTITRKWRASCAWRYVMARPAARGSAARADGGPAVAARGAVARLSGGRDAQPLRRAMAPSPPTGSSVSPSR